MSGRSLELYYVDGNPSGMVTAEVFGWTGHVLRAPRLQIRQALHRDEAKRTGVYILLGAENEAGLAYIGEAESIGKRIRDHDAGKDWWTEALFISTAGDGLHKAHVKYLESRLVEAATKAGNIRLQNGNVPPRSSLNEAASANMESFLEVLFMILPALGVDMFQTGKRDQAAVPVANTAGPVFVLSTPKNGVVGRAVLDGSDFVVQEGSRARQAWMGKGEHDFGYRLLHQKLVADGVLRVEADHAVFVTSYAFNSPSAAAAVLNGRAANGRLEWKREDDGRTFGDWEHDELERDAE